MITTAKKSIVKHREVANALRTEISSGRWKVGERLPGEQDLAKRFDVAHMTMRHAVGNLVDDGVLIRVRGKGTFIVPDASQDEDRSTLYPMALMFPADGESRDSYYFPEVLSGFQTTLAERGHTATILGQNLAPSARMLEPGCAVAYMMITAGQESEVEALRDSGYRVLAINRYHGRRNIPSVHIDDAQGIGNAVDHLVGLGHERIGFVAGPPDNLDAVERLRGFRDAVKRHNLRVAPEAGDAFVESAGYMATRHLLSLSQRPTAIICASDLAALGAIKAARDFGVSVPRGLSVVGFGDFSVADYMIPGLTTVRQGRIALGRAAAEALIDLAQGTNVEDVVLSADLIIRESTAENVASNLFAR